MEPRHLSKKFITAGCSFSDYAEVKKNYSEYLAEKLGIEYVPGYTSGCGSNYRMWRKLLSGIRNKEITSKDLLVVQYTEPTRKEIWSRHMEYINFDQTEKGSPMREPYSSGQLIKFKVNPPGYQFKEEQTLFRLLEENFTDPEYDMELFQNYHFAFLNTLERYQIKTVFLKTIYCYNIPLYESSYSTCLDIRNNIENFQIFPSDQYCLSEDDCSHLSDKGHRKVADLIYKHLQDRFDL